MDLNSILGGMVQGAKDLGTGLFDFFGSGVANVADMFQGGTKNKDDFRKWLYNTDNNQDAAAKGLGTILNGVSTAADFVPGAQAVTNNPLFNGLQGAMGGVADELKQYGKDADFGRAAQRAGVGGAAGALSAGASQALGKSSSKLLNNGLTRGAAAGALSGGIANAGYTGIEGGSFEDVLNNAISGAGTGALIGGSTGLARELIQPRHKMDAKLTSDEIKARIDNIEKQIQDIGPVSEFATDEASLAKLARIGELRKAEKAYQRGFSTYEEYEADQANRQNRLIERVREARNNQAPSEGDGMNPYNRITKRMFPEMFPENEVNASEIASSSSLRKIPVSGDDEYKLYHQTKAKSLEDFSEANRGSLGGDNGTPNGIFLKDTDRDIGLEGKNQLQLYAKMNNPKTFNDRRDITNYAMKNSPEYATLYKEAKDIDSRYIKMFEDAELKMDEAYEKHYYNETPENKALLDKATNELEKIQAEWNEKATENAIKSRNAISELLKKDGYDSAILNNDDGSFGRNIKSYIVLDKNQLDDHRVQVKTSKNNSPKNIADLMLEPASKTNISKTFFDNTGAEIPNDIAERLSGISSLVKDENGNPMRFYHGTPDGSFDTFNDGSYFTPNKWYADTYQNPQASSLSYGKLATNPTTFETYLDMRKPFDISDPEARRVYIEDYIKGGNAQGIDPYRRSYDDIKDIDWLEVENLRDFLRDEGYDYDGLIANEGGFFDDNGRTVQRGKSYIPFKGEQVITIRKAR